ncbi:MAG: FecR domain-containing protein [Phaeodactylibacter sp.]|nr:FecR domain-containing protein [Phaeodactylibacter sp.]
MDYADIIDYLNGHATAAGRQAMEAWLEASPDNRREFQRVQRLWEASGKALQPEAPDVDAAWQQVRRSSRRPARWMPILARAAAAVVFLVAGYFTWSLIQPNPLLEARQGGQPAREAVLLPDGSKVWLSEQSTLRYPESFAGKERLVRLSGRAYFEVAREEARPFLIETDAAAVRVLGTSFGLMAYPDSSTAWVQVNSGKVAFYLKGAEGQQMVLAEGEGALLDKPSGSLQRLGPEAANRIAGRTRKLVFQNASLKEAAQVLKEAYGAELTFENPNLANCRFTASFDREPLEAVLQTLEALFGIKWQRDGQEVFLNGGGCGEG